MLRLPLALALFLALTLGVRPAPAAHAADVTQDAVIAAYADGVIIPTYALLSQRLAALHQAISTLEASPTDANLQQAQSKAVC